MRASKVEKWSCSLDMCVCVCVCVREREREREIWGMGAVFSFILRCAII
jgi:hypothetical protein